MATESKVTPAMRKFARDYTPGFRGCPKALFTPDASDSEVESTIRRAFIAGDLGLPEVRALQAGQPVDPELVKIDPELREGYPR